MITNQPVGNQDDIREVTDNILKDDAETTAKTTHNGLGKIFSMSPYEQTMRLLSARVRRIMPIYFFYLVLEPKKYSEMSAGVPFKGKTFPHSADKA